MQHTLHGRHMLCYTRLSLCCLMTPEDIWCYVCPYSFLRMQITIADIRSHVKRAVHMVTAYGHFNLPQGFAGGYVWVNILTILPLRFLLYKDTPVNKRLYSKFQFFCKVPPPHPNCKWDVSDIQLFKVPIHGTATYLQLHTPPSGFQPRWESIQ